MPAGGSGETTSMGAAHARGGQIAALVDERKERWVEHISSAGLIPELWVKKREECDDSAPDESEERLFPEQLLAALQVFTWMFAVGTQCVAWVHLAAEMQGGKSGVANAVIRLCLMNPRVLGITFKRVFVLTGMSDDAWKKQTRARVPAEVRDGVRHSAGLLDVKKDLNKLHAENGLRNLLIILDESQVASSASNRPNREIYETVRGLVPVEQWVERNIRFLTISATDPAKVMAMESCRVSCQVVRLRTTKAYQSVETLNATNRIRALEDFGDIGSDESIAELKRAVASYTTPRRHILRPRRGQPGEVRAMLEREFPGSPVTEWDSAKRPVAGGSDGSSSASLEDINALLSTPPETHSFVLLKNMFYAAKTLDDSYVGVLWDRLGGGVGGDNARLQSLLGRACGYGKSKDTVIYTSAETVKRYLGFWKLVCQRPEADPATGEFSALDLHRRMPGVVAVTAADGSTMVAPVSGAADPTASSADNSLALGGGRTQTNPDNYVVEWREFNTLAKAKEFAPLVGSRLKTDAEGFYLSSTTGKSARLSYAEAKAMQTGKKTAGFCIRKDMEVGKSTHTMYVCYKDLQLAGVVFMVGKLTRIA